MNLLVGPVEEQIQDEYRRDILDVARVSFATSSPENTERHRRTLSFGSETNAGFLRTVVPSSVMTKFAAKVDANDVGDGADDEECNTATVAVIGTLAGGEEEITLQSGGGGLERER